ncbi:unnamed protein product, partial [Didymodactylos carnosus]
LKSVGTLALNGADLATSFIKHTEKNKTTFKQADLAEELGSEIIEDDVESDNDNEQ